MYPNQPRTNRTTDKPSLVAMHSSQAWSLCTQVKLGRYVLKPSFVAMQQPNTPTARSLRSDRARVRVGRYVATEHAYGSVPEPNLVAT
ncbi:hypothetical protein DY000_02009531 [Brassica cretica]|uniref:Uncharacterized protein n=1 Tax=Brassica cretica TaxID=69181 RepID=A0ABQ7C2G3_BRACR|nr:hypothetical protein DY000_02009531 [Brassica cretica]